MKVLRNEKAAFRVSAMRWERETKGRGTGWHAEAPERNFEFLYRFSQKHAFADGRIIPSAAYAEYQSPRGQGVI